MRGPNIMRLSRFLNSSGRVLAAWWRAFNREVGPREHAIAAVAVGVYLAVKSLWAAGALGVALVVAGGVQLGVILLTQAREFRVTKREGER